MANDVTTTSIYDRTVKAFVEAKLRPTLALVLIWFSTLSMMSVSSVLAPADYRTWVLNVVFGVFFFASVAVAWHVIAISYTQTPTKRRANPIS